MRKFTKMDTIVGQLFIVEEDGAIAAISSDSEAVPSDGEECLTPLLKKARQQLEEYFEGRRKTFDLPLAPKGTAFQQKVWQALQKISYGETKSYKDIAQMIDNPKACRAVGGANHRNPIMIVIPCHRVIGQNGALVGYAGGVDIKRKLLMLEGALFEK